jgi:nicotinamide mononucleotide (NMN) deamidase PncC
MDSKRESNMWPEKLKALGVNIHVVATGGGAGLQKMLWEIPGSSAYLSGCSFPYDGAEQEELLGFMPEHFCSEEAAVDLASAAYMKAYKFGGKRPVGLALTASVASEQIHKGDHRAHACIVTDDMVRSAHLIFKKDVGRKQRNRDGEDCDDLGFFLLIDSLGVAESTFSHPTYFHYKDDAALALERFMLRPYFSATGQRGTNFEGRFAIMPGAFNPPHEGHFGAAKASLEEYNYPVVFETTAAPPHKGALTVQELLKRAKLLHGYDRIFTKELPYYIDKAKAYPGHPLILGSDAMVRMLDPKWGLDPIDMFKGFIDLNTKLFVASREIDGKLVTCTDILNDILKNGERGVWALAMNVLMPLEGHWNISSTELRKQLETRV